MRNVLNVIIHQYYNYCPGDCDDIPYNDIALLELDKPLEFSNTIKPVKLPNFEQDFTDQIVTVSGWGETESANESEELRYVVHRTLSKKRCEQTGFKLKNKFVCSVPHKGTRNSACPGDSGGPVVLENKSILVGLVSFGPLRCESFIDYNVRVSHYVEWIEYNVEDLEK